MKMLQRFNQSEKHCFSIYTKQCFNISVYIIFLLSNIESETTFCFVLDPILPIMPLRLNVNREHKTLINNTKKPVSCHSTNRLSIHIIT